MTSPKLPSVVEVSTGHAAVHRVRSARHRFDKLFFAALQPVVCQQRQVLWIGLILRQSMQNAQTAGPEKIGDHDR